jgi:hypothetical protein
MSEAMLVTCRCGAVEIEISGAPIAQFYCHCDDCQVMATSFRPSVSKRSSICSASTRFAPSTTACLISSRGQPGLAVPTKR